MLAMETAFNGVSSYQSRVTKSMLCSPYLPWISSGLLCVLCLREAEFSSMNSTVLGTMLPGFFVASMTPMCPISVCFLHGPGWHSPSALQFLTHAATDLPAKRMEKRSQGVVNIHPAYSVAGRWVGSDGVWVSRWFLGASYSKLSENPRCSKCKAWGERVSTGHTCAKQAAAAQSWVLAQWPEVRRMQKGD